MEIIDLLPTLTSVSVFHSCKGSLGSGPFFQMLVFYEVFFFFHSDMHSPTCNLMCYSLLDFAECVNWTFDNALFQTKKAQWAVKYKLRKVPI